jgi:hypothetical protein
MKSLRITAFAIALACTAVAHAQTNFTGEPDPEQETTPTLCSRIASRASRGRSR